MMEILTILIPVSLLLGGMGLGAFLWAMRTRQFDDPQGDASRILIGQWDARPKPAPKDGGTGADAR
jgi:cbb3-type cytochrome oxidase maturation protein